MFVFLKPSFFFYISLSFFLTLDCPPVLKIFQMDARTAVSSWMLHSPTHGAHNVPFFFRCCCQHTGTLSLDGINLLLPGCRLRSESRTHHARRQPIQSPSSHRCGCFKRFRQKKKKEGPYRARHTPSLTERRATLYTSILRVRLFSLIEKCWEFLVVFFF